MLKQETVLKAAATVAAVAAIFILGAWTQSLRSVHHIRQYGPRHDINADYSNPIEIFGRRPIKIFRQVPRQIPPQNGGTAAEPQMT